MIISDPFKSMFEKNHSHGFFRKYQNRYLIIDVVISKVLNSKQSAKGYERIIQKILRRPGYIRCMNLKKKLSYFFNFFLLLFGLHAFYVLLYFFIYLFRNTLRNFVILPEKVKNLEVQSLIKGSL